MYLPAQLKAYWLNSSDAHISKDKKNVDLPKTVEVTIPLIIWFTVRSSKILSLKSLKK